MTQSSCFGVRRNTGGASGYEDDHCGTIVMRPGRGSNSVVESRLPKPLVAGSIPVSRSKTFRHYSLLPNSWKIEAIVIAHTLLAGS